MNRIALPKINIYNLLYDLREFLKKHRIKIVVACVLCVVAIFFGIRSGFTVYDAEDYLYAHPTNLFKFLVGKRNIVTYFIINLISALAVLSVLALCGSNFLLSYLAFAVLFLRAYVFALYASLYLIFLKISALPLILICMIPSFIVQFAIELFVTISAYEFARERRLYGSGCNNNFPTFLQRMILPAVLILLTSIIFTLLTYFLGLCIIF